ncbi:uncharacterized protein LOC108678237 [Hyalella azteca]|uniref:Uncharacterized protein LOC108678237 n=1 Tax=Hyalella azteca TaxID=294128 RepID=A0A8B7P7R3_HYAAZ|nr:uncharacterized protein LOC108678237 [Hyalella azteca]
MKLVQLLPILWELAIFYQVPGGPCHYSGVVMDAIELPIYQRDLNATQSKHTDSKYLCKSRDLPAAVHKLKIPVYLPPFVSSIKISTQPHQVGAFQHPHSSQVNNPNEFHESRAAAVLQLFHCMEESISFDFIYEEEEFKAHIVEDYCTMASIFSDIIEPMKNWENAQEVCDARILTETTAICVGESLIRILDGWLFKPPNTETRLLRDTLIRSLSAVVSVIAAFYGAMYGWGLTKPGDATHDCWAQRISSRISLKLNDQLCLGAREHEDSETRVQKFFENIELKVPNFEPNLDLTQDILISMMDSKISAPIDHDELELTRGMELIENLTLNFAWCILNKLNTRQGSVSPAKILKDICGAFVERISQLNAHTVSTASFVGRLTIEEDQYTEYHEEVLYNFDEQIVVKENFNFNEISKNKPRLFTNVEPYVVEDEQAFKRELQFNHPYLKYFLDHSLNEFPSEDSHQFDVKKKFQKIKTVLEKLLDALIAILKLDAQLKTRRYVFDASVFGRWAGLDVGLVWTLGWFGRWAGLDVGLVWTLSGGVSEPRVRRCQ